LQERLVFLNPQQISTSLHIKFKIVTALLLTDAYLTNLLHEMGELLQCKKATITITAQLLKKIAYYKNGSQSIF